MKIIPILFIVALLVGCGKKEETPITPNKTAVVEEVKANTPSVDQELAAMLRGHYHATKICFSRNANKDTFFIFWPPGQPDDGLYHGWYFITDVPFYNTQANTWFIQEMSDDNYIQVYPDVTGLTCKDQ